MTWIEPSSAVIVAVFPRAVAVKCSAAGEGLARLMAGLWIAKFLQLQQCQR